MRSGNALSWPGCVAIWGSCMHSRMSSPFKPEGGSVIGLIHGKDGTLGMPVPFERDIFLFDTCVAGTSHVEGIEALESQLREGERLAFFREPDNPHDPQAILVQTMSGQTVGYVPRRDNVVFARLMDAGKQLFGTITKKEKKGNWLSLSIQIFLHE